MNYRVNVRFNLKEISKDKRQLFYIKLENLEWTKKETNETWTCLFKESVSRYNASRIILRDLEKVKRLADLDKVEYKIQMDHINIMAGVI